MKLRNKKTGEIWDIGKVLSNDYPCWETLTQLCEDWEDYEPKEPLIKDKKIRKAVRAWAEAEKVTTIKCYQNSRCCKFYYENMEQDVYSEIKFIGGSIIDKSLNNKIYTIAELCGEEE